MKFTAFYKNNSDARTSALQVLYYAVNHGVDLSKDPLDDRRVRTVPSLPKWSEVSIPQDVQAEHMIYEDGKLNTIRLMTVDVETKNSVVEPVVQPPEVKSEPAVAETKIEQHE